MNDEKKVSFDDFVLERYKEFISQKYKDSQGHWPVISGHNVKIGKCLNYVIVFFKHTANPVMKTTSGIGDIPTSLICASTINNGNINQVRERLEKYFQATPNDAIFILKEDMSNLKTEMDEVMQKHEYSLGLTPMKIFLSHKGIDKPKIREYKDILISLGFEVWLDEDAMSAGVELERGLLQGFKESCAAIFFITPDYLDEQYLATEVNYAIAEKRKKGTKFSLITLVIDKNGNKGDVPELLKPYVWKEPRTDLESLNEIIKALPIKVGRIYWK